MRFVLSAAIALVIIAHSDLIDQFGRSVLALQTGLSELKRQLKID